MHEVRGTIRELVVDARAMLDVHTVACCYTVDGRESQDSMGGDVEWECLWGFWRVSLD